MALHGLDIVFVSNAFANGGAARVLSVLAGEFVGVGKTVGVAIYLEYPGEYPLPAEVEKEYGPSGKSRFIEARRIAWLRDVAKRNPDAAIIAFEYFVNMQALVACAGLPNKVVVSERNDPARVGAGFPNDWLRERLYRRADMLVCQTEDAAAHFSEKVEKCVILNPVKGGLPKPYEGERRKVVVSFCRLEKQKNLPMLVRAFCEFRRSHPDYTLEIYGDGSERESLFALVCSLGIDESVSILPGRPDVHEVVRDAAMFVQPSNYEGLSNSMLEAMAIGLPVICTDCPCGGARMVIKDGENGLLVPVGDEAALVRAMLRVADDPRLADGLSLGTSRIRNALSPKSIGGKWMKVVADVE